MKAAEIVATFQTTILAFYLEPHLLTTQKMLIYLPLFKPQFVFLIYLYFVRVLIYFISSCVNGSPPQRGHQSRESVTHSSVRRTTNKGTIGMYTFATLFPHYNIMSPPYPNESCYSRSYATRPLKSITPLFASHFN